MPANQPLSPKKLCITDLDGTLLHSAGIISDTNKQALIDLGELGILRVLATGRSLYSLKNVIPHDVPFDYVIFATGAGILNWQTQELIFSHDLDAEAVKEVCDTLEEFEIDYMLQHKIPDTHLIHYRIKSGIPDFKERIKRYEDFAEELDLNHLDEIMEATEFLAMVAQDQEEIYHELHRRLHPYSAVRTTSPVDLCTIWIEIFAPGINKGGALHYIMRKFQARPQEIMVIGNDYNDLEMLKISPHAFVTANAPQELKDKYHTVASCDTNGFAEAVRIWLSS
jgi:hypothetical protein